MGFSVSDAVSPSSSTSCIVLCGVCICIAAVPHTSERTSLHMLVMLAHCGLGQEASLAYMSDPALSQTASMVVSYQV